ncbi:hypothetical protein ACJRPK_14000 [Aquimarina sp. 2-A2]|uniref:hypothetical protein n=1 Tax=Aquimarina sp. 2-A2 TaxID=3382644 RepID=UPI00387EEB5A
MKEKKKIGIIGNASTGNSLVYELAKNKCGLPIVVVHKETFYCDGVAQTGETARCKEQCSYCIDRRSEK